MRVFISHAPEDAAIAKQLYHDLNQLPDIELWMADMDLLPGQDRKREIQKAIRESRYVIAVLSRRSMEQAGSVHREMRLALDELDEMPEGEIFIIPVRVDECSPAHDRLRDIRSADLFPSYADGVALILRVLGMPAKVVRPEGDSGRSVDSGSGEKAGSPEAYSRNVNIGGNVSHSVIIIGDGNTAKVIRMIKDAGISGSESEGQ